MGYPVPANAPQVTIGSRTVAVGAFDWNTPVGAFFKVGIYEKGGNGEWLEVSGLVTYPNAGDCLADMKAKGGAVKYMQWLVTAINAGFTKLFSAAPAASTSSEPSDDSQAKGYIASAISAMSLVNVNGIPTLK